MRETKKEAEESLESAPLERKETVEKNLNPLRWVGGSQ